MEVEGGRTGGSPHTQEKKKKNRQKANAGLEFAVLPANLGGGVQPYWVRGFSSSLRLREPVATVASCSRNL